MSERDPVNADGEARTTRKSGIVSLIVAAVLVIILVIVVLLWWRGGDEPEPQRQAVPVETERSAPEPQPERLPEPESELPTPPVAVPPPETESQQEPSPPVQLPQLADSTPVLIEDLEQRDVSTRPIRSDHLIRDLAIFVYNLSEGELIRESASVAGPDARFSTQVVDDQLYIDERSYSRYDELVEWFVNLENNMVVDVFVMYQPLFEEALAEIAHPDENFTDQVIQGIDVLLATPEPEGLLALTDDQVMYTFADPELEELPAAQKQMLRLGLQNQQRVKRKLRELRAVLEDRQAVN